MNEFSPWTQGNWYALGSLLIEFGFLIAAVWFARNILRTMRSFQEQAGALLKLSITAPAERHSAATISKSSLAEASPYWLPPETQTPHLPEPQENGPSRFAVSWHRLSLWLQAPMNASGVAPWRRAINWLQAPISS